MASLKISLMLGEDSGITSVSIGKHTLTAENGSCIIPCEFFSAYDDADSIIGNARRDAAEIVRIAQERADATTRQALDDAEATRAKAEEVLKDAQNAAAQTKQQ